jgi:hypothetical protein
MSVPVFHALDASRQEVRLARLAPSSDINEQASCTLEIISLQENREYHALSYAWGDAAVTRPIKLQGLEWNVTTNLEVALRHLRDPYEERLFWIDAICINQFDIRERSSQVPLMGHVYSQAKSVRIWLGEAAENSDMAIEVLERLGEGETLLNLTINGQHLDKSHLDAVSKLFRRPWWQRVWIQQEFTLAVEAVFQCGSKKIDLESLTYFGTVSSPPVWPDLQDAYRRFGGDAVVEFIASTQRSLIRLKETEEMYRLHLEDCYEGRLDAFVAMLSLGRRLLVTQDHDRIYGFLGMAPSTLRDLIRTEYATPVADVYRHIALLLLQTSRSLAILSQTELCREGDPGPHTSLMERGGQFASVLPSWVPDWSDPSFVAHSRLARYHLYSACGDKRLSLNVIDNCVLHLSGYLLDRVCRTNVVRKYKSFQRTCDMDSKLKQHRRYVGGGSMFNAFWRTLVTDVIDESDMNPTERRCRSTDFQRYWDYADYEHAKFDEVRRDKAFVRVFADPDDLAFFVCDRGYIGKGPQATNIGDLVYIVAGGAQPLILRPSPEAQKPNTFKLVGQCYVHGVMDGEAVDPAKYRKPTFKDELRWLIFGGQRADRNLPCQDFTDIFLD